MEFTLIKAHAFRSSRLLSAHFKDFTLIGVYVYWISRLLEFRIIGVHVYWISRFLEFTLIGVQALKSAQDLELTLIKSHTF